MKKIEVNVYPKEQSPKLFQNKILELLTRTHPIVIDAMYLLLTYFSIQHFQVANDASTGYLIGVFLGGFFTWSLAEYLMHRFIYHKIADATYNTGIQYLFHGIHHEYPNDKTRLVLPLIPSLVFALVFFGLFYLIMGDTAFVFAPGFVIGYCVYMTIHFTVHKVEPPKKFNFWWRFHNIHHFQQHDRCFGVTSPLWDIIFRTMPEKNRQTVDVKVSKKEDD